MKTPRPKTQTERFQQVAAKIEQEANAGFPLLPPGQVIPTGLPDLGTVECTTCHFYEHGRCRRNPPSGGQWATVSSYDWCGEWAKRVEKPAAQSNGEVVA